MIESPRLTLKEKQWNLREDAILDSAAELIGSKGYNAMTMDDVANSVGISKATLYIHFSSKHDLVVSVACRTLDQAFARFAEIDETADAHAKVVQLVDNLVDCRYGPGAPPYIESIGELIEILSTENPFMEKERRNLDFIAQILREAESAGVLTSGVSVLVAVHMIIGMFRNLELEQAISQRKIQLDEIAESIKRMILRA